MPRTIRPLRWTRLVPVALLALAAACGSSDARYSAAEAEEQIEYMPVAADRAEMSLPAEVAPAPGSRGDAATPAGALAQAEPAGETRMTSMIIRTGEAVVQVDSLEPAVTAVRAMAERLGGYVANSSIQTGAQRMREARVELKVPSGRFEEALGGLRPLGTVESVTTASQDVGEEYVDVSARVANGRRLEERLVQLLASRTGKLEDVLQVERELARVREEIERAEGRLRYLRTRVALSTLTLTLHEPYPVAGDYPGSSPIADAFRDAWGNFVQFTAGFISSLGWLLPLGVLFFAAAWIARRAWAVLRPRRAEPGQPLRIRPRGSAKDAEWNADVEDDAAAPPASVP